MRQIWIPTHGSAGVLEIREAPDPTPGPGEVAVDVRAAGINFADLLGTPVEFQHFEEIVNYHPGCLEE